MTVHTLVIRTTLKEDWLSIIPNKPNSCTTRPIKISKMLRNETENSNSEGRLFAG